MTVCAGASAAGPTAKAVAPSRHHTCTIQATLSGASSSAPRWSVVGLTGKATAWSREISSRPPPDATPDTRLSSRKIARALGITMLTSTMR